MNTVSLAKTSPSDLPTLDINGELVKACRCGEGVAYWSYITQKSEANLYKQLFAGAKKREQVLKSEQEHNNIVAELRSLHNDVILVRDITAAPRHSTQFLSSQPK